MISTKGRYALRLMVDLAQKENGSFVTLEDIAERQGISVKYLETIVCRLVKAGLLAGARGKGGGYKLVKPDSEYTVLEILSAAEETLKPVSCLENGKICERAEKCRTLPVWEGLDKVINDYLSKIKLSDLAVDKK